MSDLKEKAINASFWAMVDNFMNLGGSFIISLVLARLLLPSDYGLIGMTTFFITFFSVFVQSGFVLSLVRDQNAAQKDYSTIFFFNVAVCLVSYAILFFIAPYVAFFFEMGELTGILRLLGISLIIDGLSIVQTAIRVKQINYKIQAKISITGTTAGGVVAIVMAYKGCGVWSLVAQILIRSFVRSLLFWLTSKWRPVLLFSWACLKKHWAYSSSLLRNDLTIVVFDNLYNLAIGKFYSTSLLGQYTRAKNFLDMASMSITRILSNGVSFPVLCKVQGVPEELKDKFFHFLRLIVYISSLTTFMFVAVSDSLIPVMIGDQWDLSIYYIKLLAFSSFLYPINVYNISIARVVGRTDIFANAILFQRLMIIPAVIVGVFTSIDVMIIGACVASLFSWIYNMIRVKSLVRVGLMKQMEMQVKVVSVPFVVSLVVYLFYWLCSSCFSDIAMLLLQLSLALVLLVSLSELIRGKEYLELKWILLAKLKRL